MFWVSVTPLGVPSTPVRGLLGLWVWLCVLLGLDVAPGQVQGLNDPWLGLILILRVLLSPFLIACQGGEE